MSRYVARAMKSGHTPRPNPAFCSVESSCRHHFVSGSARSAAFRVNKHDVIALRTIHCCSRTRVTKALVKVHSVTGSKIRKVLPLGRDLNNWLIKIYPSQRFLNEDRAGGICRIHASACISRLFLLHSRRACGICCAYALATAADFQRRSQFFRSTPLSHAQWCYSAPPPLCIAKSRLPARVPIIFCL